MQPPDDGSGGRDGDRGAIFSKRYDVDQILGVIESPQRKARGQNLPVPLDGPRLLHRSQVRRQFVSTLRKDAAVEALGGLPQPGESWHGLMDGTFDGFDLVDAVLAHAAPARIDELLVATLGFNERNAVHLLALMDAGRIGTCRLMVSCWFKADQAEAAVVARLAEELPRRGGWFHASRSHAKLLLFALSDGRRLVVETSANMRTCRSVEQFCLSNAAALFEFHVNWMEAARAQETQ